VATQDKIADTQAVVQIETGAHPSYTARMGPVKKKAPPVVADVEVPGGAGAALEEMIANAGEAKLSLKDLKSMVPGGNDEVKGEVEEEKMEAVSSESVEATSLTELRAIPEEVAGPAVEEPEEVTLSLKELQNMRRRKRKKRANR